MAGGRSSDRNKQVRDKIEREIERRREERKQDLLRRRIELAKNGLRQYEARDLGAAAKTFVTYIRILETWKKIAPRTLAPGHFDIKTDIAELLLINSVYWHLCKIYDRVGTPTSDVEFRHFLNQYIIFSKGMTYQPLAAETLRKYLFGAHPAHRTDFKNAYKALSNSKCFIATELITEIQAPTLPALQRFRDQRLQRSRLGRGFISAYYALGPYAARGVARLPQGARRCLGRTLDRIAILTSAESRSGSAGK